MVNLPDDIEIEAHKAASALELACTKLWAEKHAATAYINQAWQEGRIGVSMRDHLYTATAEWIKQRIPEATRQWREANVYYQNLKSDRIWGRR